MDLEKLFENAECEKSILKIADGDHDALRVIHKYMNRQIYAVAYAVLRDFSLSDDIVQETYVKIMEKASSYEKGTNARAWILSIARNLSIDVYPGVLWTAPITTCGRRKPVSTKAPFCFPWRSSARSIRWTTRNGRS